jgi:glutathione peroxidase
MYMKKFFSACIAGLLIACTGLHAQTDSTSIHQFSIAGAGGSAIQFSAFAGKKILVVNTASLANDNSQITQLQSLRQQQAHNLVVVAVPCTDFNNLEPEDDNAVIDNKYRQQFGVSFPITVKLRASGPAMHSLYQFLTRRQKNGIMSSQVTKNFQKYLLDNNGRLIGVFDGTVSPLSPTIVNAINDN